MVGNLSFLLYFVPKPKTPDVERSRWRVSQATGRSSLPEVPFNMYGNVISGLNPSRGGRESAALARDFRKKSVTFH